MSESSLNEIEIIRLLEQTKDYKFVSKLSGLSVSALVTRNCRKWNIRISPWNKEKIDKLIEIFGETSDKEIANLLGLSIKQIQSKARKLKLRKSNSYIKQIQEKTSKNISSGSQRHQFKKENDSTIFKGSGLNHPNYIKDRSKIKGNRRRQFRFSQTIMNLIRSNQKDQCNLCSNSLFYKGEFDHIQPVVIGGNSNQENCQLLCSNCHLLKTREEQKLSNNFKDLTKLQEAYSFIARNLV